MQFYILQMSLRKRFLIQNITNFTLNNILPERNIKYNKSLNIIQRKEQQIINLKDN